MGKRKEKPRDHPLELISTSSSVRLTSKEVAFYFPLSRIHPVTIFLPFFSLFPSAATDMLRPLTDFSNSSSSKNSLSHLSCCCNNSFRRVSCTATCIRWKPDPPLMRLFDALGRCEVILCTLAVEYWLGGQPFTSVRNSPIISEVASFIWHSP